MSSKISHILDVMRKKKRAVLHLSLVPKRPSWQLINGGPEITVSSRTVQAMIKLGAITERGDSLFLGLVPSQIWHYRPVLDWKRFGYRNNSYQARGSPPGYGVYILRWMSLDEPRGYWVQFYTSQGRGTVSEIAYRVGKLEHAMVLAQLHHDRRKELILKYGDKRNVPREAWMEFRAELASKREARA